MRTKNENWDADYVRELFTQGFDCGQVVLGYFAEDLGLTEEQALKISSSFGGGCGQGGTCGAVAGALMALGMKYGQSVPEDFAQKDIMGAKQGAFIGQFRKEHGSILCRDLLGHDVSQPGEFEKVVEEGTMMTFCPKLCIDCIHMTETIFEEEGSNEN